MYDTNVRFNHIQALRFFAAAAVVVDHSVIFWHMKFPGVIDEATRDYFGWTGGWAVALFFCISGFVITHSSQNLSPLRFLSVRLLRIFPAFWLACGLAAAIKLFLFHSLDWRAEGYDWKVLSLLPAGPRSYPLRIEWSLIYEVFFYVLVAIVLALPWKNRIFWFSVVWLAAILGARAVGHQYSDRYPTFPEIFISSRNLPFIGGVFVYYYGRSTFVRRWYPFMPFWALGIALLAQITPHDFGVTITQAISSMLLVAFAVERDHIKPMANDGPLVKLGDASYGLYLFHITVITVLLALWQGSHSWVVTVGSVIAFGLSIGLMYGVLEQRLYRAMKRRLDALLGAPSGSTKEVKVSTPATREAR
ncbi:hypothetical protein C9I56_02705 [Paraburkholderia caribensis]|uniref:acyltransferase family protein n=1 Tax=Paraburkholderia caribensis TaxID=75105 RepID=UPI000D16D309|nr:acyltransferase [Paraburkholderia caribensis]PTB30292.1 hypothetical protein C9I56_02705 [Paraburkholderia caribensis]